MFACRSKGSRCNKHVSGANRYFHLPVWASSPSIALGASETLWIFPECGHFPYRRQTPQNRRCLDAGRDAQGRQNAIGGRLPAFCRRRAEPLLAHHLIPTDGQCVRIRSCAFLQIGFIEIRLCMGLTLSMFLAQAGDHPVLLGILALVIGVTIISGATDAPNAIASAVSTRCLSPTAALILAAVFNFAGLVGMTYISTAVAHTMFNMVDFSGNTHQALLALIAAMIGSIGWGVFCWFWGIPASKSHSLIAGVTGGAIALNGLAGVVLSEWMLVIYGMAFSLVGGFILGMATTKIIEFFFSCVDRKRGNRVCVVLQDICACALSFLHGAQDGQKFMSIGLLGIALAFGMETSGAADFPLWLMVICSLAMSLGTLLGGKRIIKSVAMDMVSLEKYQGVAASVSTVITLFVASMTGMPVSTSHCSTASIMGVGASRSFRRVNWGVARRMVWAWVLTFPCCGFIGWSLAKLFMMF